MRFLGPSSAIFIAAFFAIAPPPTAARQLEPTTADALIADALKTWEVPGIAVVIVDRERVLWLKGYGRRELNSEPPVTADTVFPLASCSKAFTTTLLAMLVSDGKLAWDDPVRKHWPDFRLADPPADAQVTLRDLLTHRTGLAGHDLLWYRSPLSQEELVRRVGRLPLEKPFRTAFQYQSILYTAAGLAAGRAGGKSWADLVRLRVFEPLGMTSAHCTTPAVAEATGRATPHRPDAKGTLRPIPWYVQSEPNPAGSVHASARDLAAWLRFQLGDGTFGGRRLVSSADLAETHTAQFAVRLEGAARAANPDTLLMSYGLGWVIQDYRGELLVSHAGAIDGFRAHITLMPRAGYALAILSNRHQTRMNLALSNTLVDRLLGLPPRDWNAYFKEFVRTEEEARRETRLRRDNERRPDKPPTRPLSDYVGEYEHPAYGPASVRLVDGKLRWEWSSFREVLGHFGGDTFATDDEELDDAIVEFKVEGHKVRGFTFLDLWFPKK